MPSPSPISPLGPPLRRELGRWDLTAIGVNQVIGGALFVQPALYAANVGAWSLWLVAAVGAASLLVALTFAEVASRFDATGGPYLYTRAAFGRFAAFEVGWMLWFTRVASWAAVVNVLATALSFYLPTLGTGWSRSLFITAVIVAIAWINIRGIRLSSFVLNLLTIGKLLPLVTFVAVGLFFVDGSALVPKGAPTLASLSATGLLLIFAFGGYEVITVPAGEARDPRHGVPFALIMTIAFVSALTVLVQVVALGTLPNLAASKTPLADAASLWMGAAGAALITLGAVFSTAGNNMGGALSGSRNLYALAEQGDLPPVFGRVQPLFRTPVNAIIITSAATLVLAVSGKYADLALVSAISRLLVYLATCASALRLRSPSFANRVNAPRFTVPYGSVIPVSAIIIALAMLTGARRDQLIAGVVALAVGGVLYAIAVRGRPVYPSPIPQEP
jgi:amino acid transporter